MNRKTFLTASAAALAGVCVTPLNSVASLTKQHKAYTFLSMLNDLDSFSLQNLPASLCKSYTSFLDNDVTNSFTIDVNAIYKLSPTCYALPVKKISLFSSESQELVLFIKNTFGYRYHILDKQMMDAYDHIVSNYKENVEAMALDLDVSKFIAPTKMHSYSKKFSKKQFAFENFYGNRITLVTTAKKNYSMVC